MAYPLAQQQAQLAADHPLEASVGAGVVIGGTVAASAVAAEVLLLRLASGLRWAGALRPALALSRVTWGGAETELVGARAAWQGMRASPKAFLGQGFTRMAADYGAQTSANFITGSDDPWLDVNVLESVMAGYGIQPVGIGIGSAAININARFHVKTIFNSDHDHRVYPGSFAAQAGVGVLMGYLGHGADRLLAPTSRMVALSLYMKSALRVGPRLAYPIGIGFSHLIPHLMGTTEEALEGTADNYLTPAPDSLKRASPH